MVNFSYCREVKNLFKEEESAKINVLFDVSVLANGAEMTTARSGVFFVAYNILIEMLKRKELNIKFYCNPSKRFLVDMVVIKDYLLASVPFVEYTFWDKKIANYEKVKYENKKNQGNKMLRPFIKMALNFSTLMSGLANVFCPQNKSLMGFDVFFSPWGSVPQSVNKIESIKKYLFVHDIIPLIFPENFPDIKKKNSALYKQFHVFDNNVYYFTNSEYTKSDFVKHTGFDAEKVSVAPLSTGIKYENIKDINKIDEIKNKYNIPLDKKYLFSLCSLEPRKNLIFAVKNFIEFIKRNNIDDFVFVLGGGHWDIFIQKLNETISNLVDFQDKIIKIGYVSDEDLPYLYNGAEMFVFPSIYEGFGMPILEAMKSGCPVICSNVTSMPEVIGDCGIQISPDNDEELIKAFEKMYFDKEFRTKCIEQGLQRAKIFSWENAVKIISDKIIKDFQMN